MREAERLIEEHNERVRNRRLGSGILDLTKNGAGMMIDEDENERHPIERPHRYSVE